MIIEEYKQELENWKEEHTNFYNECLHAMKKSQGNPWSLYAYIRLCNV